MSAVSFAPSPILQALHFTDIDEFRRSVRKFCVEFTPLVRKISVQQAILNLAAFDIVVVQSFPRIADTQLATDTTAICFTMDDDEPVRFNGVDVDPAIVGIGHGGSGFSIAEKTGARLAVINFSPEIHGRGWPDTRPHFGVFATTTAAQKKLRLLVWEILKFASASSDELLAPSTMAAVKESLLLAVDQLFAGTDSSRPRRSLHSARTFTLFQKIEAQLLDDLKSPIYSDALASTAGVSVRTLQDIIAQYRGMSLHRYLRLKRLWLVRKRLLTGPVSVKTCALEYGFWHMGDFSRSYQTHFGETPSQTLAQAR
ncbi:MAG: helix-turn-helix domain-containing protein [Bradyrhizobium sp.]